MKLAQTRQTTIKLLDSIDEGYLDKDYVINACLSYMSEDQVADMCQVNQFFDQEEEEDQNVE